MWLYSRLRVELASPVVSSASPRLHAIRGRTAMLHKLMFEKKAILGGLVPHPYSLIIFCNRFNLLFSSSLASTISLVS